MTIHLRMHWPSAAVSLSSFARHLVTLANEIHFVEIGLDAAPDLRGGVADEVVIAIRRALEDAMESDKTEDQDEIAARLSALLHVLDDGGMSLTASVQQHSVESAAGVERIDVLSIVVARRDMREPRTAPTREAERSFA